MRVVIDLDGAVAVVSDKHVQFGESRLPGWPKIDVKLQVVRSKDLGHDFLLCFLMLFVQNVDFLIDFVELSSNGHFPIGHTDHLVRHQKHRVFQLLDFFVSLLHILLELLEVNVRVQVNGCNFSGLPHFLIL